MVNSVKNSSLYRERYKLALVGLLLLASIFVLVLERVHTRLNGENAYGFLRVNLGLAWIPFLAALLAYVTSRNKITFYLFMPICTLAWLAFFPNAPYLMTDLQHLVDNTGSAPVWFDVILLLWFAWTGLLLAISSLYLMQEIVTRAFNWLIGWIFAIGVTSLSSIGVYLGRFMRWNSWDLLQSPFPMVKDLYGIVRHPRSNLYSYGFTILFTLLFLFIYLGVHLFSRAVVEGRQEGGKP
jgi:uncharacterized membrane protein